MTSARKNLGGGQERTEAEGGKEGGTHNMGFTAIPPALSLLPSSSFGGGGGRAVTEHEAHDDDSISSLSYVARSVRSRR